MSTTTSRTSSTRTSSTTAMVPAVTSGAALADCLPVPERHEPHVEHSARTRVYTEPSQRQVLARIRRTISLLAETSGTRPVTTESFRTLVPAAVDTVLTNERLDTYVRTGRQQVIAGVYSYVFDYWPSDAHPVSAHVRDAVAQLVSNAAHPAAAPDTVAAADLQATMFTPRDPRLAWQLPDGSFVFDEVVTNHHPSGLTGHAITRRIRADLVLGPRLARSLGGTFAGIRLLPLKRPSYEAHLVTPLADMPARAWDRDVHIPLTSRLLDTTDLSLDGYRMTGGVSR